MSEYYIPKTSTGGEASPDRPDWEKVVTPETLSQQDELKLQPEFLKRVSSKVALMDDDLKLIKKDFEIYKDKLLEQSNRNIEIIGIFSSVLALLIIDVSIIKSANNFLSAILMISSLACVMGTFAFLIHFFFTPEDKFKASIHKIWWPISILIAFIILGILANVLHWSWAQ
jgi:hypothetical protein